MAWSYPPAGEYPEPHRIELATDEINSYPLDHVRVGLRLGLGIRPRLKATLWAHNGLLLTALMPRRSGRPPVKTERIGGLLQFGFVVHHGTVTNTIVASPVDRTLSLSGLAGEASLAIARRDAQGRLLWAAACDTFACTADRQVVAARQGEPLVLAEWRP